jgi:chemotaxis signal transduction protein
VIAEDRVIHEDTGRARSIWCYVVSLGGRLFALPDDTDTVILPFISAVPPITSLPAGLAPSYILGLINVAQRGELLIDLPRLLGLRDGPLPPSMSEGRRVIVVGEGHPPESDAYRLAFAVDYGYELLEGVPQDLPEQHPLGIYVLDILTTSRGDAALLDLKRVCNKVLQDMEATRLWNESAPRSAQDDL